MDDSILASIAKMVGLTDSDTFFDSDLMIHVNSAIGILNHMGVGTPGYMVTSRDDKWSDLSSDKRILSMIKQFIFIKVKLLFDTPSNSFVVDAYNNSLNELQSRLYSIVNYESEVE